MERREMTQEQYESLIEKFSGLGGDREAETTLCFNKQDEHDGYISFWSNRGRDVARTLKRIRPKDILWWQAHGGGLFLKIKLSAVRGPWSITKVTAGKD